MRMLAVLLIGLFALASGAQARAVPEWVHDEGRGHPLTGVIIDLNSGERLTPERLLERLADVDRLLIGERHDNVDHHRLQAWLIEQLHARRHISTVLLEMLVPAQQPAVGQAQLAFARGEPPTDLRHALDWQAGWDWSLYGPIVTSVLQQGISLQAANLDRDEVLAIYRAAPAEQMPEPLAQIRETERVLGEVIRAAHCEMLPESQVQPMVAIQRQRDRRMAEQVLQAATPVVLLAGGFHARRDLGVPLYLQELAPGSGFKVLMLADVGETVSSAEADFVWYTPQAPQVDHCEALRKSSGLERDAKKDPAAPGQKP